MKISKRASTLLSLILAVAFIAIVLVMMVLMPFIIDSAPMMQSIYSYFSSEEGALISGNVVFWIWFYAISAIAAVCCGSIVFLLFRVRRKLVFSKISVSLIRFASWCCILIAAVCIGVCGYFHMAYVLALAAGFLGLCLRVVKNVIEEATAIKNENDLTV
ncbi:MAG: DUF2975 domain-containing protein [Clostridia bacterium]|nr:DUF2975 domain-containing protein [Clostridia bacterium]